MKCSKNLRPLSDRSYYWHECVVLVASVLSVIPSMIIIVNELRSRHRLVPLLSSLVFIFLVTILNVKNHYLDRSICPKTRFGKLISSFFAFASSWKTQDVTLAHSEGETKAKQVMSSVLYIILYYFFLIVTAGILILAIITWRCEYHYTVDILTALAWGIVFSLEMGFLLYRWTYRVLPNLLLAIACFLLFCCFLSLTHQKELILGLSFMTPSRSAFLLDEDLTKWLGWGSVVAIVSTIISKASEDMWYGMGRNATGEYEKLNYRFKLQRRKLLSYRGDGISRLGIVMLAFAIVLPICGILLLYCKSGTALQILGRIYVLALSFSVVGFVFHSFITDEHLLRAENSYILDRRKAAGESINRQNIACQAAPWEWACYCQVLSNIYCSRSPIYYENTIQHHNSLFDFSFELLKNPDIQNPCPTRLLIDAVTIFSEQFSLYCREEAEIEQLGIELQFAISLEKYTEFQTSHVKTINFRKNTFILKVLSDILNSYDDSFGTLLSVDNAVPEDVRVLLAYDYIKYIVFSQGARDNSCKLSWWCFGPKYMNIENLQDYINDQTKITDIIRMRALQAETYRLSFPFLAIELLSERWGTKRVHIKSGGDPFHAYVTAYTKYNDHFGATLHDASSMFPTLWVDRLDSRVESFVAQKMSGFEKQCKQMQLGSANRKV